MDSLAPTDADAARVRDLLSRLAGEPLPAPVATRLAARLDQELPTPAPRRRLLAHGYRRAALSAAVPLAIGVAIAFGVYHQDSGVSDRGAFGPISTAPALADEDAAGSTAAAASSRAASSGAASAASSAEAAPTAAGSTVVTTALGAAPTGPTAAAAPAASTVAADGTMKAASEAQSPPVRVPAIVNRYPPDAVGSLRKHGFRVSFAPVPPIERAGAGTNGYAVIGEDPAGGSTAPKGATVVLRLGLSVNGGGSGPPATGTTVRVPDVVGLEANAALRRLTGAGLLVTLRGSTTPVSSLAIAAQDVRPGSSVAGGTVVTLSFGS